MTDEQSDVREYKVDGKYSETEETILEYLYKHPGWEIGTYKLVQVLEAKTAMITPEDQQKYSDEIQYAVETLISHRLVKGKSFTGKYYSLYDFGVNSKGGGGSHSTTTPR